MRLVHKLVLVSLPLLAIHVLTAAAGEFKLEPGFTLLFNGKDLTGWKTKKGDSLDAKMETPGKRFQVRDGVLVIDPKGKGESFIHTAKEFAKDVHIKFDCLPETGCNNDIYIRGQKFDIKKGVTGLKEGEWNAFDITVTGGKVEFKCNGATQKSVKSKDSPEASSPLMIRAEFGGAQIRRIRVKNAP